MGILPDVAKSDRQFLAIHLRFALRITLSHSFHHGHLYHEHLYHEFLSVFGTAFVVKTQTSKSNMLSQFFVSHQIK